MCVRHRDIEVTGCPALLNGRCRVGLTRTISERQPYHHVHRRRLAQANIDADAGQIAARRVAHRFQRITPARFEVDRLPHAARFAVALLSFQLERMRGVVDAHHKSMHVRDASLRRQLERERRVAALMFTELVSVQPDSCPPVRRAEYDEDALRLPRQRDRDIA